MMRNRAMTTKATLAAGTFLAVLGTATTLPAATTDAASRAEIRDIVVEEASESATVPTSLALAVARVESNFDADARSSAGARGVMQIMPETARGEFGISPDRLWNPQTNVELGIAYLERLYRQYDGEWPLALSHYNGGSLDGHGGDAIPHSYTKDYVRTVLAWNGRYQREHAERRLASAETTGEPGGDYWMTEDSGVERSWREYLDVADRWIAVAKGEKSEPPLPDARARAAEAEPQADVRDSQRARTTDRRQARDRRRGDETVATIRDGEPHFGTDLEREARDLARRFRKSIESDARGDGLNFGS